MSKPFEIGIITKPQGIGGEVRVLPTTDDPTRFGLLDSVCIRSAQGAETTHKIVSARQHKGMVLIKFEGINDRNAAEKLVKSVLTIPPEKALKLDIDEYFIRDLIGLSVQSKDGTKLGTIKDVFPTGANDVYVIENAGESFMIPAIKDVVLDVSIATNTMTVHLIDGLKELTT